MSWHPGFGCLTRPQMCVEFSMVILSVGLAVMFGIFARRHFLAGRGLRGWLMLIGVLASGGSATVWTGTTMVGVPPFFAGEPRFAPCDHGERHAVVRLHSDDPTRLDSGI